MCKFVNNAKHGRIDECMRKVISNLTWWIPSNQILACCCGHKKYPKTIVVKGKDWSYPMELLSATWIYRARKFYKKDKQGYYFIPEVRDGTR